MKLYRKVTLLEVVSEGPHNSVVREHGTEKMFLMSTESLRDMYEEVSVEQGQE